MFTWSHMTLYVGACLPPELIWCTSTLEILITFPVAVNFLEIFSKTVMEENEDLILIPSDTTGTDEQIGGAQDLWSSLKIF